MWSYRRPEWRRRGSPGAGPGGTSPARPPARPATDRRSPMRPGPGRRGAVGWWPTSIRAPSSSRSSPAVGAGGVRGRPGGGPDSLLGAEAEEASAFARTGVVAVAAGAHLFVDLLAGRADRVLLRVPAGGPHLAAQGHHGPAGYRRSRHLVLTHVVGVPLGVAGVGLLAHL